MSERVLHRQSPLADQVERILLERITRGEYPPASRLPSESELSAEFNVSRATIRAALGALAANGMLKRRHGSGTFVSQLTHIANPLNEVVDYRNLIIGQGFEFGFRHISAAIHEPDRAVREALGLAPGAEVLEVVKAFTADGELVIYTINVIPEHVFKDRLTREEALQPGATEPLFAFMEQRCGQRVEYYRATVRPEIARHIKLGDHTPEVDPLLPVLVMEEVGYNRDEQAVLYEVEVLLGDRMRFDLIRRCRP